MRLSFPLPRVDFRKVTPDELAKRVLCIFVNDYNGKFNIPGLPLWLNLFRERVYILSDDIHGSKDLDVWNQTLSHIPHFDIRYSQIPSHIRVFNPTSTLFVFMVQNLFTLPLNPISILDKLKHPKRTYTNFKITLEKFQAMIHDHSNPQLDMHLYNSQQGMYNHRPDNQNGSKSNISSPAVSSEVAASIKHAD